MTRDATAAALSASQAEHARVAIFAQLDFDSGFVRVNSTDRNLSFTPDGGSPLEVFNGVGSLGSVTGIGETSELRASRAELTLTGIPPSFISLAFENTQGRRGRLWLAFLDDNYAIINEPVLAFEGLMDNSQIRLGAQGTITIPINNRLIEWERASAILYTNEDQKNFFPGDVGFEFVQQTADKQLLWGFGGTGQIPNSVKPRLPGERDNRLPDGQVAHPGRDAGDAGGTESGRTQGQKINAQI